MSSIKIRTKRLEDGNTQIRCLIIHPMETGRNKDATKKLIPAHYIQTLTVTHNGKIIATCNMGAGISKDPYFAFLLKGGAVGDEIIIDWLDNLGNRDSEKHKIS